MRIVIEVAGGVIQDVMFTDLARDLLAEVSDADYSGMPESFNGWLRRVREELDAQPLAVLVADGDPDALPVEIEYGEAEAVLAPDVVTAGWEAFQEQEAQQEEQRREVEGEATAQQYERLAEAEQR